MIQKISADNPNVKWFALTVFTISVIFVNINLYELFRGLQFIDGHLSGKILEEKAVCEINQKIFAVLKFVWKFLDGIAAAIFILLWWFRYKHYSDYSPSSLYLSMAWLTWSVPNILPNDYLIHGFSQLNNLFLIWALWDFRNGGFDEFSKYFNKVGLKKNNFIPATCVGFFVIIIIEFILLNRLGKDNNPGKYLDAVVSSIVILWLCTASFLAFLRRFIGKTGYALCGLVVLCCFAGIYSQFANASQPFSVNSIVMSFAFHTSNTLIISALTISWAFATLLEKEKYLDQLKLEQLEKDKQRDKEAVVLAQKQRDDTIHVIRNSLRYLEWDMKKSKNEDSMRVASVRTLFEMLHLNKPSDAFDFLKGTYLKTYLENIFSQLEKAFQWRKFEFDVSQIPTTFSVWETSLIKLGRIITEATINAYKYGNQAAKIEIRLETDRIIFSIEDEGDGYDFSGKTNHNKKSLGVEFMDAYLADLRGTKTIQSLGRGTKIIFIIELTKFIKDEDTVA